MQESVEVYERLKLKAEFKYAYRMLILLLLQAGDFNALSKQMMRFVGDACIGIWEDDPPTKIETVMMMTRLWNGEAAYDKAKERGVIIRCGDGILACGLTKPHVFQQCVVPSLRTFFNAQGTYAKDKQQTIEAFIEKLYKEGDFKVKEQTVKVQFNDIDMKMK